MYTRTLALALTLTLTLTHTLALILALTLTRTLTLTLTLTASRLRTSTPMGSRTGSRTGSRDFERKLSFEPLTEAQLAELRGNSFRTANRAQSGSKSSEFDIGFDEAIGLVAPITCPERSHSSLPPAAEFNTPRHSLRCSNGTLSELRPPRCEGDAEIAEVRRDHHEVVAVHEERYEFADIGMREVCHALMVDPNPSPSPDPGPNPNPNPNPNPKPHPNPNQVCHALMVDPQKRQIYGCLQAAGLSSFHGAFEEEEGLDEQSGSPSASLDHEDHGFKKAASFSGGLDARRQPRLTHESSMNMGGAQPRPRRHAREDVLGDSGWRPVTAVSSVLAVALGRDPSTGANAKNKLWRDPSTRRRSRDSDARNSNRSSDECQDGGASFKKMLSSGRDTSQHGGNSFRGMLSSPSPSRITPMSPSAVGGLALERAHAASPGSFRGKLSSASPGPSSSWMSSNRWGRKEGGSFRERLTGEIDSSRDRGASSRQRYLQDSRDNLQDSERAPPSARSPLTKFGEQGRASSAAPFRLPGDVASFNSASDPLEFGRPSPLEMGPTSPPRHLLIRTMPPTPTTPSPSSRLRGVFELVARGPLAQKLKAGIPYGSPLKPPPTPSRLLQKAACLSPSFVRRQVHPQPTLSAASAGDSTDTTRSAMSDSSGTYASDPHLSTSQGALRLGSSSTSQGGLGYSSGLGDSSGLDGSADMWTSSLRLPLHPPSAISPTPLRNDTSAPGSARSDHTSAPSSSRSDHTPASLRSSAVTPASIRPGGAPGACAIALPTTVLPELSLQASWEGKAVIHATMETPNSVMHAAMELISPGSLRPGSLRGSAFLTTEVSPGSPTSPKLNGISQPRVARKLVFTDSLNSAFTDSTNAPDSTDASLRVEEISGRRSE